MPYKFFDTLLDSTNRARGKKGKLIPISIGIHVLVLAAVLVLPLLSFHDLPDPVMNGAIRAFLVEAAPAPPRPRLPHRRPRPRRRHGW